MRDASEDARRFVHQLGRPRTLEGLAQRPNVQADGRVRVTVEYPSLGDYAEAALQLEALKGMAQEDAGARLRGRRKNSKNTARPRQVSRRKHLWPIGHK